MPNSQSKRVNFAVAKDSPNYPDFLDIQIKSFQDFFQLETKSDERIVEGLFNTFKENFPITDTRNQFVLEFIDYFVDPPRYSIQECIERGLTYSVPLKARLKLFCTDPEHEDFETIVQDVFLGTIPYMTPRGTFVINGAERIVVSQLHRSPGVFFGQSFHANGTKLYSARVIPFKGSWIEFATDINSVMYAYIDRKKKLPVTTLFRAIGYESDKDILEIFDLAEEVKVSKTGLKKVLGRKLAARVLKTWHEDFVDEDTGEVISIERNEIIIDRDTLLEKDHIEIIIEADVKTILLHNNETTNEEINRMLNVIYPKKFLRENQLPLKKILTRKMNGEHEYRFFEWENFFRKSKLKVIKKLIIKESKLKNKKNKQGIIEKKVDFKIGGFERKKIVYVLQK